MMKMLRFPEQMNSPLTVKRLTALWALNEAGMCGMMHVFSIVQPDIQD